MDFSQGYEALEQAAMHWEAAGLHPHDEEMQEEDNEDFYGNGMANEDVKPGAAEPGSGDLLSSIMNNDSNSSNGQPTREQQVTAEERKAENQRRAALLREKLMAQRQNTPIKTGSIASRPETPAKQIQQTAPQPATRTSNTEAENPSSDALGLEALLAEGRAAAAAKIKAKQVQSVKTDIAPPQQQPTVPASAPRIIALPPADIQNTSQAAPTQNTPAHSNNLTDVYYADLQPWLEMTGYHDVPFRTAKLRTFKERRALEEEAARINERLEKLRREEQAEMEAMRSSTAHPSSTVPTAAPSLPPNMPSGDVAIMTAVANKLTNGIKRPHSPPPAEKVTRRREDVTPGFRIRGANEDSPRDTRPPTATRRPSSPKPLDRRISYPDARRRSLDAGPGPRSRDPSLERRQAYYKRGDNDRDREAALYKRDIAASALTPGRGYDQYAPRDGPYTPRTNGRGGAYGNGGSGGGGRAGYQREHQQYRGSAGLDLAKGGVRYFMIKSWNHENVLTAQRDGLWATQTKNEEILTEAFRGARHVVLLFSVNKSMAFQGCAVMTSPPLPSLPKPPFCAKLNWGTSPAFTLRWLATTPVHFRMVGHLKNTCNLDERGEPRAVLVGKDGQEISSDAGMGVCWVLDEAEAIEGRDGGGGGGR